MNLIKKNIQKTYGTHKNNYYFKLVKKHKG